MYDNFDEDVSTINNSEKNINKIFLFIATLIFIILFVFIIYRSYQISKRKNDLNSIELVKGMEGEIKTKVVNQPENINTIDNLDKEFYNAVGNNETENEGEIKVIDTDLNVNAELESKIDTLLENNEELQDQKLMETDVEVNKNIKTIVVNQEADPLNNLIASIDVETKEVVPVNNKKVEQKLVKKEFKIQLVSMKNKNSAQDYIDKIKKTSKLFNSLTPLVDEVNLKEKGMFFRVQFGYFSTKEEAEAFCKKYLEENNNNKLLNCILIKN